MTASELSVPPWVEPLEPCRATKVFLVTREDFCLFSTIEVLK